MAGWYIDPRGVADVLSGVQSELSDLLHEFERIGVATQNAAQNSSSPIVAEALSTFASATSVDMHAIADRVSAAMTACVTATNGYLGADATMAGNATSAAHR